MRVHWPVSVPSRPRADVAAPVTVDPTAATTTPAPASPTTLPTPWRPRSTAAPSSPSSPSSTSLQLQKKPAPDGRRFASAQLAELATMARLGVPTVVVFDLDNTVFDTRHRTLQAGRAYDAHHGTSFFSEATIDAIAVDGRRTAEALGLPAPHDDAFATFWDAFFWTPEHLVHDQPIDDIVALVQAAQAASSRVMFLTGRIQSFHEASLVQLRRIGLDVDATDIVCKPDLSVRTGPFKSAWLEDIVARGTFVGFFVTEGVSDLRHVEARLPSLPLLRLDCSFEDGAALAHLPTLPRAF